MMYTNYNTLPTAVIHLSILLLHWRRRRHLIAVLYACTVVQHQDSQHLHAFFTTGHAVGLALMALLLLLALVELLLAEALLGSVLVGLDLLGQLQLTVDLCVYLLLKFTYLLTTIRRWYSIYW